MRAGKIIKKVILCLVILILTAAAILCYCWNHTNIPKLHLDGNLEDMWEKTDIREVSFVYRDKEQEVSGFAEIKVQGTSSLGYVKKNYTLKFFEDEGHEDKLKIDVGWGAQNKYCMKANWIDRTHARNVVTARIAAKMQQMYNLLTQAPNNGLIDGFPVEIYNNGDFLGLYTFNIPKDDWQFAMDSDNPDHIVLCGEGWDPANLFKDMPDFETWAVEVGEESEETLEKMNRLFDFVLNSSDEDFRNNFGQYINLDSALNYYVMADLGYMADNMGKNMLLVTYDGMEWYLSLYDLDSTWGTSYDGVSLVDYESKMLAMDRNNLFARMEKAFPQELAQRYFELRSSVLSNENIMAEFEAFRDEIPFLTFQKEIIRWGVGRIRTRDELPGFEYEQIEAYLEFVSERLDDKYSAMLG